jgi:hypothetical protein
MVAGGFPGCRHLRGFQARRLVSRVRFAWGGMMFVADNLAAWLVGLLADAGRR